MSTVRTSRPKKPTAPKTLTAEEIRQAGKPITQSYAVDAACSGNPGLLEYRGVHTETQACIFKQGPYKDGTNNVGEFLAIVHALALLKRQGIEDPNLL